MSVEIPISLENIDFSIDSDILKTAEDLLGHPKMTRELAKTWIHSPIKEAIDRVAIGLLGTLITWPISIVGIAGVLTFDGRPANYNLKVGFLGDNNNFINLTTIPKIRTLSLGVDKFEEENPLQATVFQGSRKRIEPSQDPRAHSSFGMFLRRTSVDEFPQFWSVLRGSIAGVGPRAYTLPELEGLQILFARHDIKKDVFPEGFPDYRKAITYAHPKPGFASLTSATLRKALTVTERLYLDYLYATLANPWGDMRIIKATIQVAFKGTGVR